MSVLDEVSAEMARAAARYGPMTSSHEGYGVLAEEVSELLEAIRGGYAETVRAEAIQVAAVAVRLAGQCRDIGTFADRSGFR